MKCIGSHGVIAQLLAQNKAAGLAFSNAVKSIAGDELTSVVVKAEPITESEIEHAAGVAQSASTSSGGYVIEEWQPRQQSELVEISDDDQGGVQGETSDQLELKPDCAARVAPSSSTSSGGYVIEEWQPRQQFELIEISDDDQGDVNGQLKLEPKNEPNEQADLDLTTEIRLYRYLLDLQEAALQSSEEGEAEIEERPGRGRLPSFMDWSNEDQNECQNQELSLPKLESDSESETNL